MKRSLNNDFVVADSDFNVDEAIKVHNNVMQDEINKYIQEKQIDKEKNIIKEQGELEIVPINTYILIKPYDMNPYQKINVSEGGIQLNTFDDAKFKNPESGVEDEQVYFIKVGTVIETSPLSRFVQKGDDVIYKVGTAVPVPFFQLGMVVVSETSILTVINKGLTKRFESVKEK